MSYFLVQTCLNQIPNKFELVLISAKRTKDVLLKNSKLFVDPLKDKNTVISLREIEKGFNLKFFEDN